VKFRGFYLAEPVNAENENQNSSISMQQGESIVILALNFGPTNLTCGKARAELAGSCSPWAANLCRFANTRCMHA